MASTITIGGAGPSLVADAYELPKKRIIVCCDGTWKDSVSSNSPLTNVSRISRLITTADVYGMQQIVSYHTGIGSGTSSPANCLDGMSGRGISANIRDAYTFICHNYSNPEDEIVLIGFSRGAFTVRCIAAFMDDVGLLTKAGLRYLPQLYHAWKEAGAKDPLCSKLVDQKLLRLGINIQICAVWDTVGSLGFPMPGPIPQRASKRLGFVNSRLSKNILMAIQALALNERRKHFMATVWAEENAPGILKQCWFLGAHSDVGGGNKDVGLADITLVWMIAQLNRHIGFDLDGLPDFAMDRLISVEEERKQFNIEVNVAAVRPVTMGLASGGSIVHGSSRTRDVIRRSKAFPDYNVEDDLTYEGAINNPMRGPFLLGGSLPRKPRQNLMNNHGSYRNSKTTPVATGETMHFSVRVLLGTGLRSCPALRKYSTKIEQSKAKTGVMWHLHHKNGIGTKIELPEDHFSDLEGQFLESWMKKERGELVGTSRIPLATAPIANIALPMKAELPDINASLSPTTAMSLSDILLPLLSEAQAPTINVINGAAEAREGTRPPAGQTSLARVFGVTYK